MTYKNLFTVLFLLGCAVAHAQNDTITLKELVIADTQLRDFSQTQSVQQLTDSVMARIGASLTALLLANTAVYFKENGPGMVSSPSFRGTSAQQTAVIWNGLNINSQLNGQTDFSTVNARDFSQVSVRAGGGSVVYGSSAIGGSIHLDNELLFKKRFDNEFRADYGSFETYGLNYKVQAGTEKYSINVSASRNSSKNRFRYPGYTLYNDNGQYYNSSYNAAFGYKISAKDILRFYSTLFSGERHFSRTLAAPSKSLYDDVNARNLLEWTGLYGNFTSRVKAAWLHEFFRYYEDFSSPLHSFGKVNTFIGRYDAMYHFTSKMKLNAIADVTTNQGSGSSFGKPDRTTYSGALLWSQVVSNVVTYEAGIRKESGSAYSSPLLFSGGGKFTISPLYTVCVNGSRNFRAPTYNDLYWNGTGNPNLKPEISTQAELSNVFTKFGASLTITGYYIRFKDMLRWLPGTDGVWRPENVDKARSYGAESVFGYNKTIGSHTVSLAATYSYTISKKDGNPYQLMYVPKHRAVASASYAYRKLSVYYRHLFTGRVYFTSDDSGPINAYNVSGAGAEYTFKVLKGCSLGAQVNNLYNEQYMNVASRPMPGRNYNMYMIFKF